MSDYVVRRVSAGVVLQPVVGLAALAVWTASGGGPRPLMVFFGVLVVVSAAVRARTVGTRLRVDSAGITLGGGQTRVPPVQVPWASVREVVVITDAAEPQVGVRLQPGAPLPTGVRGLVQDPARPDSVQPSLVRGVPGLDRAALEAAVQPYGVRVVTASLT